MTAYASLCGEGEGGDCTFQLITHTISMFIKALFNEAGQTSILQTGHFLSLTPGDRDFLLNILEFSPLVLSSSSPSSSEDSEDELLKLIVLLRV